MNNTPNHISPTKKLVARPDESLPDKWQAGVRTGAGALNIPVNRTSALFNVDIGRLNISVYE